MSSDRESLVEALEAIEAGCRAVGVFPLETLSRTDGQALLARLDKLDQKIVAVHRRLNGRLLTTALHRQVSA
jgi:DNA invertase Pin-like site-specific DNA recombinase